MHKLKFENNINKSVWDTLAQRKVIARICALFRHTPGNELGKRLGHRLLKPWYMSRDDHNGKIRIRKQRTDVGKWDH
jgi:hypothetical protein